MFIKNSILIAAMLVISSGMASVNNKPQLPLANGNKVNPYAKAGVPVYKEVLQQRRKKSTLLLAKNLMHLTSNQQVKVANFLKKEEYSAIHPDHTDNQGTGLDTINSEE